ncbi:hypothetical protein SOI901_69 [Erwinia phage SOI901]
MIKFTGFKVSAPATPEQLKLSDFGVQFAVDDTGRCWYDIVKELAEKYPEHYKVHVRDGGSVAAYSKDASTLFPHEGDIIVVDSIPVTMAAGNGYWAFNGTSFVPDSADIQAAEDAKADLLAKASGVIQSIQALVDDGEATEEETERLANLKKFRTTVLRMDVSGGTSIVLPKMP